MLRFLCIFCGVAIICGCTPDPQSNTFKERYNVYAEIEMNEGSTELPFPNSSPHAASYLIKSSIPIKQVEDFADAIVRRMDAKTLAEYLELQDEIDERYGRILRRSINPRQWKSLVGYSKDTVLFGFYVARDEDSIRRMVMTVQHAKYMISKHSQSP